MKRYMPRNLISQLRHESGQVLILVLVLLTVGSLIIAPLLSYMGTGLKADATYANRATDYYSADSGAADALWQIKYGHLSDYGLFTVPYDTYGYDVSGTDYDYRTPVVANGLNVNVNIANVWIPKDISIQGQNLRNLVESAKLVVAGSPAGIASQKIAISYDRGASDPTLKVTDVGVWLPPGFSYVAGSCQLDDPNTPSALYHTDDVTVSDWAGGTAVVWHYADPLLFMSLPEVHASENHLKTDLLFSFTAVQTGALPDAVAWIKTTGVADIPFAWDADVRVFKIDARAPGGTEINSYAIKVEQRQLAKAIPGDYLAIGNSLMTDDVPDGGHSRDTMHEATPGNPGVGSATASTIPDNAEVAEAYLYWSGWFDDSPSSPNPTAVFSDTCSNLNNWTTVSSVWSISTGNGNPSPSFIGHSSSTQVDTDPVRYVASNASLINLSAYSVATITWQYETGGSPASSDKLFVSFWNGTAWVDVTGIAGETQAFSGSVGSWTAPNGATGYYTIPASCLGPDFRVRFHLTGFSTSGRNAYIDNVIVAAVLFNDSFANLNNWSQTGTAWTLTASGNNPYPASQGHSTAGNNDPTRYLTMKTGVLNLSAYSGATINWDSWISGSPGGSDRLYISFWNGTTWVDETGSSGETEVFNGNIGTSPVPYSISVPANSLRVNFQVRFRAYGFSTSGRNCYLDNVKVKINVFSSPCSDFVSWELTNSAWTSDGSKFVGEYTGTDNDARYLTLTTGRDLHTYTNEVLSVSWDQYESGALAATDLLQFQFSGDGGSTWNAIATAGQDDVQSGGFATTTKNFAANIPSGLVTSNFKLRFYLGGFGAGAYCYVDNIKINIWMVASYDSCSYLTNWTHDTDWSNYYNAEAIGHHSGGNGYLSMATSLDLSAYTEQSASIYWLQHEDGTLSSSDSLQYQFSGDGGAHWSSLLTAFSDDIGSSPVAYSHTIPTQYLTSSFKLRLMITGFDTSGKNCYVNDIIVFGSGLMADTTASFFLDGHQVSFAGNGTPQIDVAHDLTAQRAHVINGLDHESASGCYYSSFVDVTSLIRTYGQKGENGNCSGNGTYAVGNVGADPGTQQSYAGWSLIIIYTSPETQGHQLYLYDDFAMVGHYENLDFDQDGSPGGTIGGFLVPQKLAGEVNSASFTCFVGEGDDWLTGQTSTYQMGEYVAMNGTKLWDGINTTDNSASNPDNPWNGKSIGMSADGVDVDTYHVTWASNVLQAGDTAARLDMQTDQDVWTLVYLILSFRSQTTTGGTVTYLIKHYGN